MSDINLNFPSTLEIKFCRFLHIHFSYKLKDLVRTERKKQCSIHRFIAYETLILNIFF